MRQTPLPTVTFCLLLIIITGLLTGCLRSVPGMDDAVFPMAEPAATATLPVPSPPPAPTATRDPAAPVILLQQTVNGQPLYLIRYLVADETCLVATFDLQALATTHCGAYAGAGIGLVGTLTDPAGGTVRLAYGLALDPAISAVAIEFTSGGNAHTFVENGGYALVLTGSQTPRRAVAVNQFGNLIDRWLFE